MPKTFRYKAKRRAKKAYRKKYKKYKKAYKKRYGYGEMRTKIVYSRPVEFNTWQVGDDTTEGRAVVNW